ncbi:winged helix-turn-helix transcriptional regulator [Sphingomonas sp. RT2P30]|uniref:winged helix-turn-helix transcriptional regulator n=1 Tax=Parasphingomonas halimpatiens TaxID=3096162 RepID=UPI003FA7E00A
MTGVRREGLSGCALAAALQAVGERWSMMILQAVFDDLHHYEEFHAELGIARNILADRLVRLVRCGVLTREGLPENRRKIRYALTPKGEALLPVMLALRQWGEAWGTGSTSASPSPARSRADERSPPGPTALPSTFM